MRRRGTGELAGARTRPRSATRPLAHGMAIVTRRAPARRAATPRASAARARAMACLQRSLLPRSTRPSPVVVGALSTCTSLGRAQLRALPRARAAAGKAALLPGSEGAAGGRVAAHNSRAMHLMYYMNDAGERVYTLKVRARPCLAMCRMSGGGAAFRVGRAAELTLLCRACAEGNSGQQTHRVCAPRCPPAPSPSPDPPADPPLSLRQPASRRTTSSQSTG